MSNTPTLLYMLLTGMRLVGGFPFVKKKRLIPLQDDDLTHSHTQNHKKQQSTFFTLSTTEDEAIYNKNMFWSCWTILLGIAATLCFAIGFWNLKSPIFGFPLELASAFYAYKLNEVMDNVTLAGLMFHISYRRLKLKEVVEFSHQLLRGLGSDLPVPSLPLWNSFPFTISLVATLSIIIILIYGGLYDVVTTTIEIFQQIAFFLIGTNILCLFQWVVWLSIHEYECIVISLNSCLDAEYQHHYEYPEMILPATIVSRSQVMCYNGMRAKKTKLTNSLGNRKLVSVSEVNHCLRDAQERLMQVNKLLQLANMYCGVPATLMMLYSVVACILSLFYMSFVLQLEALHIAVTCLFTINALVAPMFMCNVPYSLHKKVGDMFTLYFFYIVCASGSMIHF